LGGENFSPPQELGVPKSDAFCWRILGKLQKKLTKNLKKQFFEKSAFFDSGI